MKVVLDTNVWLSGIFWKGEAYKLISIINNKEIGIIITKKILLEIIDVLNKEAKFQTYIQNKKLAIEDLLKTILTISKLISSRSILDIVKEHHSDNKIVEAAVDGNVDYILSYDNHLLKIKEYSGIKILKPSDFIKNLAKGMGYRLLRLWG